MAAPYPDQQAYPQQPYHQFPQGGYQPAPAQFASQQAKPFPAQDRPPSYDYGGQPGYQPIPAAAPAIATSTTVVVTAQPTPVATAYQAPPAADYSGMAMCALVCSIFTLLFCGLSLVSLTLSIPALLLAIVALGSTGSSQRNNARASIALNVIVIVLFLVFWVIFIPAYVIFFPRRLTL